MSNLILALLLAAFAVVNFPRASGATNYHEINLSGATERVPSRCHANLKERWNHHHCDKWWKFLHQD